MRSFTKKQRKTIAMNIRNAMEKSFPGKGSGKRLAAGLGVAPSAVSQWAAGSRTPSLSSLCAMSRLFGIPLHRLCDLPGGGDGTEDPAFDIMRLVAVWKDRSAARAKSAPATAGEGEAIRLIRRELLDLLDDAPGNE